MIKLTQPIVDEQVRSSIVNEQVPRSNLLADENEGRGPRNEAKIAHPDERAIFLVEDGAGWIKVRHTTKWSILLV